MAESLGHSQSKYANKIAMIYTVKSIGVSGNTYSQKLLVAYMLGEYPTSLPFDALKKLCAAYGETYKKRKTESGKL
jgi:hypothetical protein